MSEEINNYTHAFWGERKTASITFITDGDKIVGAFTQDGESETILIGRSFNDVDKATQELVLLMQHRNGILNFKPDGSLADNVTESIIPDCMAIAAVDTGKGWPRK